MNNFYDELYKQAGVFSGAFKWFSTHAARAPRNYRLGQNLSRTFEGVAQHDRPFKHILVQDRPIGQRVLQGTHYKPGTMAEGGFLDMFKPTNIYERTVGAVKDNIEPFRGNAPLGTKLKNAWQNFKDDINYKPGEIIDAGNGKFVQNIHKRTPFGKLLYGTQMTLPGATATAYLASDKSKPASQRVGSAALQGLAISPMGLHVSTPIYTGQLAWTGAKAVKNYLKKPSVRQPEQRRLQYYNN